MLLTARDVIELRVTSAGQPYADVIYSYAY